MSNVKVVLNKNGIKELLKSSEMMMICEGEANRALSKLGDGYEISTYTGPNRVNASIKAVSAKAEKENLEQNTILKALGK